MIGGFKPTNPILFFDGGYLYAFHDTTRVERLDVTKPGKQWQSVKFKSQDK